MNIVEDLKYNLKVRNNLTILIYINLIVFVLISALRVILFLVNGNPQSIISYIGVPAATESFYLKPWTIISYMFVHQGFIHLLFNLLFLYWFGKIFVQFLNQRQLLGLYLLGGLVGGALYIISFNAFPVFDEIRSVSIAIGASASVMAIIIAAATLVPNYNLYMLFFGQVRLKYIAIFVVLIDVLSIPTDNSGGHIAHIGGAIIGFIFILFYKKNIDITKWITAVLDFFRELFVPRKSIRVTHKKSKRTESDYEYNSRKKAEQKEIDSILEKIAKTGYKSLTEKEKEKLFKSSNKSN